MPKTLIKPIEDRPRPLDVGGISISVLASRFETDNYEIFHAVGSEGKGPGPHYHPWDESIYMTRGDLHCGVGEEETLATPGMFIHIPAGTVHWFKFGKDGGEFISMTSRGNASAMFKAFSEGINWESPDREELVSLAAMHGQVVID